MTRKDIIVNIGLIIAGSLLGSAFTLTALASRLETRVDVQEKATEALTTAIATKADAAAMSELITKADLRSLSDTLRSNERLQDRRDSDQDRRIENLERTVSSQGKILTDVDKKVDIVIALLREHQKETAK